jgi:Fic family protein
MKFLKGLDDDIKKALIAQLRNLWSHNSTAIEGNTLTLGETAFVIEEGLTVSGKPLKDHQEVVGHSTAIDLIYALLEKDNILKENILELHKSVQSQVVVDIYKPVGNWKREPNGTTVKIGDKQTYIEYASPEDTPELMEIWLSILNEKMQGVVLKKDAVEAYSKLHLSFVSIHPFWDGNGRMARLLSNLPVIKAGFPPIVISKKDRFEYISRLARYQERTGQLDIKKPLLQHNEHLDLFTDFCDKSWRYSMELVSQSLVIQKKRDEKKDMK